MAHPVVWFEVMGKDADKLQGFYGELFGWKMKIDNPMKYGVVTTGSDKGIPGGVGQQEPGGKPYVTFYVETSDLAATLARAEKLGGRTILPPTELPNVTLAMFADPEGQVIGLVKG
jgi:predicted enzyme related to lactoylglutathione lyase